MEESHARMAATETQVLRRSCEALLGVGAGLLADGDLNDEEITFLNAWLEDNKEIATTWPGKVVYARVRDVLADGVITEDEREHLKKTLGDLISGTLDDTGASCDSTTGLPIDDIDGISIADNAFCFTGNFLYGPRVACERAVQERGGASFPGVGPEVNYLVIGTLASEEWAETLHGIEIEKAIEHKEEGHPISIISEEQWLQFL
jgi:hypothetical protein